VSHDPLQAEIVVHLDPVSTRSLVCISPERFSRLESLEQLALASQAITDETLWAIVRAGATVPIADLPFINAASDALRRLVAARDSLIPTLPVPLLPPASLPLASTPPAA
jgi:hypothetical protein